LGIRFYEINLRANQLNPPSIIVQNFSQFLDEKQINRTIPEKNPRMLGGKRCNWNILMPVNSLYIFQYLLIRGLLDVK
jgi:hypothetical protein